MREKVWYEFQHIKFGDEYLNLYLNRLKRSRKITNILTIVFSTSGVFSWAIWEYLPVVTSALIAIIHLFKLVENQIIPTDKDIEQVAILKDRFFEYWNKLERLWVESETDGSTNEEIVQRFYALRDSYAQDIKTLESKLDVQSITKLENRADQSTREYLKQYHL